MDGSQLFRIFWALLLLLLSGVSPQDHNIPATGQDFSLFEDKLERKEILSELLDLKSYLESQFGGIDALDTRAKDVENKVLETEAKKAKKLDSIQSLLRELNSKARGDGPKSWAPEQWLTKISGAEIANITCKANVNKTVISTSELEPPVRKIHRDVEDLRRKNRDERFRNREFHEGVLASVKALHKTVNLTSARIQSRG